MLPLFRIVEEEMTKSTFNAIQAENAKAGHGGWNLPNDGTPAYPDEICGYASDVSVNRGDEISFFVSTPDPHFQYEVYRLGWYDGQRGRLITSGTVDAQNQLATLGFDATTGACNWNTSFSLQTECESDSTEWCSGVYVMILVAAKSGKKSRIVFTVRDDSRDSEFLVVVDDLTRQAYNGFGEVSSYSEIDWLGLSRKIPEETFRCRGENTVSFDRPSFGNDEFHSGWPNFVYFGTLAFIKYIEEQGRNVTYASDVDLARNPSVLDMHKAILFIGHSEYWTEDMWVAVVTARDNGVHLGFFSSNICYRVCNYNEGATGRTFYCKKHGPPGGEDLWRSKSTHNRESILIGVDFHDLNDVGRGDGPDGKVTKKDYTIINKDHWVCVGTGCENGDTIPLVVDYEADRRSSQSPPQTEVIANSSPGGQIVSEMTVYQHGSAIVFASGVMFWSHALPLDGLHAPGFPVPLARAMTKNVLDRFES
jgi:hypothetical protein